MPFAFDMIGRLRDNLSMKKPRTNVFEKGNETPSKRKLSRLINQKMTEQQRDNFQKQLKYERKKSQIITMSLVMLGLFILILLTIIFN
jgi:hypothetical protein